MRHHLALAVALPALLVALACSPRPSATAGDGGGDLPAGEDTGGEASAAAGQSRGEPGEAAEAADDAAESERGDAMSSRAVAESVQIMVKKSFPVQVSATVEGYLPDPCTEILEVTAEREGNTFRVALPTHRDPEVLCAQVIQPFTRTVELDVHGLAAGEYEVLAGDAGATFTLATDNRLDVRPR